MQLFYDESGNTGVDLTSIIQPIFCLASTSIDADLAWSLVTPLIRSGQREAKYNKLKTTQKGQADIVNFFRSDELKLSNSKFMLADKTYYLITHLVDKLIEPQLHESGIDLYKNDAHVGLVNIWYYMGEYIFPGQWKNILDAFLNTIRRQDDLAYNQFDSLLTYAANSTPADFRDIATGLLLARGRLNEFIGGIFKDMEAFDPAVDLFISLTNEWMDDYPCMFNITHDDCKPLKSSQNYLRALMTPIAPRMIGYGNRQAELPLRILNLDFGDSIVHPQLQVADMIAGAAIDCLMAWSGRKPLQRYHEALKESNLEKLFSDGMLPNINNITKLNPSKPGERNLVDGSAEFLSQVGYFSKK